MAAKDGPVLSFPGGDHRSKPATAPELFENSFEWAAKAKECQEIAVAALHDGDELTAIREFRRAELTLALARMVLVESLQADPGRR